MKDPQRLLDSAATAPEMALLRAGDAEEPSELGRQRLAAALGIAIGVSATATATAATASQAGAGASAAVGKVAGAKLAAPWLAALLGGAMLTGAAVTYVAVQPNEAAPVAVTTASRPGQPASLAPHTAAAASSEAAGSEQALALEEAPAERVVRSAAAAASGDPKSIAREIAALDAVRRSLAGGQSAAALKQLGDYGRSHPRGVLRQEATLLRIEALAGAGDRAAAKRLADRFLNDNPTSPHAKRVRALVGNSP